MAAFASSPVLETQTLIGHPSPKILVHPLLKDFCDPLLPKYAILKQPMLS